MMLLALLVALATSVSADFAGDAHAVMASASHLNSVASEWNRGSGLAGAIGIQRAFYPLSSAVRNLESSASQFQVSQQDAEALGELSTTVGVLLNTLSVKATDLKGIGAQQIVQSDINGLVSPVQNIISNVHANGKHDCKFIEGLAQPVAGIKAGFQSCNAAYGADQPSFPEMKC